MHTSGCKLCTIYTDTIILQTLVLCEYKVWLHGFLFVCVCDSYKYDFYQKTTSKK